MVEILMTKNKKFKIFFKDSKDRTFDLDYTLHDSIVAEKWFRQIKHLKNIPIDEVESDLVDLSDLHSIYKEFCEFAGIKAQALPGVVPQAQLNTMHQLYEDLHEKLSRQKDNSALYKFHRAIHFYESKQIDSKHNGIGHIGWGVKGGPLEEKFNCNQFYEQSIIKNNIYLPWSELGKTPVQYFNDKEPNEQSRFNNLAKPHITLRSQFFIAKNDLEPLQLDKQFVDWFAQYKDQWFIHHGIDKWDSIDERSAPLLAHADSDYVLKDEKFVRIEI